MICKQLQRPSNKILIRTIHKLITYQDQNGMLLLENSKSIIIVIQLMWVKSGKLLLLEEASTNLLFIINDEFPNILNFIKIW